MEKVIEIPADARTVTLELKKSSAFTLRAVLPQIKGRVELVIEDVFQTSSMSAVDRYRVRDVRGRDLVEKLERSRVVNGEYILGLVPTIEADETGTVRVIVRIPVPGEEG